MKGLDLRRPGLALAVGLAMPLIACVSPGSRLPADLHFEVGAYSLALEGYRDHLKTAAGTPVEDRVLFRYALTHVLAEEGEGLRAAERWLRELLRRFPHTRWRPEAELVLKLARQLHSLDDAVADERRLVAGLRADREALRSRLDREGEQQQQEVRSLGERLASLEQELESHATRIQAREAELARLRQELEALKRIDSQYPPPR